MRNKLKILLLSIVTWEYCNGQQYDYIARYIDAYENYLQSCSFTNLQLPSITQNSIQGHFQKGKKNKCFDHFVCIPTDSTYFFDSDSIRLTLVTKPFVANRHKLLMSDTLCLEIDDVIKIGTRFEIPKFEITDIHLEWNQIEVLIPRETYANFYNLNASDSYGTPNGNVELILNKSERLCLVHITTSSVVRTYHLLLVLMSSELKGNVVWESDNY